MSVSAFLLRFVDWRLILGGTVLGLVCGCALYFGFTSSEIATRDDIRTKVATVAAENDKSRAQIDLYEQFLLEAADVERRYIEVLGQVPTEAELEGVLAEAGKLADSSGATVTEFTPGKPTQVINSEIASGKLAAISEQPIHLEARTDFVGLRTLVERLNSSNRLISISSFTIRQRAIAPGDTLEATVELSTFSKRVDAAPSVPPENTQQPVVAAPR